MNSELEYDHVISLGFFCSVAQELIKVGLRDASYPLDWLISDIEGVSHLLMSKFSNFLDQDLLCFDTSDENVVVNNTLGLRFHHDFSDKIGLQEQLPAVMKKYQKRIDRLYVNIKEPTLFVRYLRYQEELCFWSESSSQLISFVKSYNLQNNFCLLIDSDYYKPKSYFPEAVAACFPISKDENDCVSRNFLNNHSDPYRYFMDLPYVNSRRSENMQHPSFSVGNRV